MIYLVAAFVLMIIVLQLMLLLFFRPGDRTLQTIPGSSELPFVSVLVAARNEETNIRQCLESLANQNYPVEKVEILVGDDSSSDQTAQVIREIAKTYQNVHYFSIDQNSAPGGTGGKAQVLSHLADMAGGEIFFITDADICTPRNWLYSMLSGFSHSNTGIVNGITAVKNHPFQDLEWLYAQCMLKVITDYFRPVTAIGNNMVIKKSVYLSTGGYRQIPFSLTEDFALFKAAYHKGFDLSQLFNKSVMAVTTPVPGIMALLKQRKRWMQGAVRLPWIVVITLGLQSLYLPILLGAVLLSPFIGGVLAVIKWSIQAIIFYKIYATLNRPLPWIALIVYDIYSGIVDLIVLIYYLIPTRIEWKGRKY